MSYAGEQIKTSVSHVGRLNLCYWDITLSVTFRNIKKLLG